MRLADWQTIDYQAAWTQQQTLFNALIEAKRAGSDTSDLQTLVLCEHPHVYTLGRSGKEANLLISNELLQKIGASFYHIDRGGDITYHGPGQLVGYPILDLEQQRLSLKGYIFTLEAIIIDLLRDFGIVGERLAGATGVWIEPHSTQARKICAIGVRASRFVTMHGFALNVNTDLSYFNHINPCGFVDKGVTSIAKECQQLIDIQEVKKKLIAQFNAHGIIINE